MVLLRATRSAAGVAGVMLLPAIWSTSGAQAAPPRVTVMAQHAAPFQRAAPMFHAPTMQRVAPGVVGPPSTVRPNVTRPLSVNPTFRPPPNNAEITPSVQHVNPGLPFNNPSALRPNLDNASALHNTVQEVTPSVQSVNPSLPLNTSASVAPPARVTLKPLVSPAQLRGAASGVVPTAPAFAAVRLHDKFWPIHRDSKFIWVRGQRRLLAPVGLLGVALIGGSYWYPDGYVSMDGPACTGFTADGCQLQWRMVDIEDGGSEPQCVQYCPQAAPPPLEEAATLPPPPPLPSDNGVCQTTIYSEPNFAGNSAPTGDGQPSLSQSGWRNEISSIVVGAGVWEFFSDENFAGESMLLPPGTYATLPAEWTKRIGSFMCVRPAA
jgi:Beta/Gamma crystallin